MAKKRKLVWRVSEAPTGQYRSFQHRSWPSASYANGDPAVSISCADDYVPSRAKTGQHAELVVCVADHSAKPVWKWMRLKRTFVSLQEAKTVIDAFLERHPHYVPVAISGNHDAVTTVTLTKPTDAL